ncbi:DUF6801 domain-containing protein [Actinomadura rupiterrae]|uniref:DUF6801 domain-containing protein n=1 Tax=Actinomadura rupiterrae TaxID=559627 RepID=UPI0020A33B43|nr:DUF6801 domain-containing protein [Actinomadura rupiterrae]MCP2339129.1 hypothetical protein [Actinomadura rupiterrae]
MIERLLGAAALATVAMLPAVAPATPARADQVSLTLNYHCNYPLIGSQPVKVDVKADIPKTIKVGEPTPRFTISSVSLVNAAATRGLRAVYAAKIEGTATAYASVVAPGYPNGLKVRAFLPIASTPIPDSGEFPVKADGSTPSLTFDEPGHAKIVVGDLLLTLDPKLADGTETGLLTFESECTQDPGQNNVLAEPEIVPAADADKGFALKGTTTLKTTGAVAPLTGSFKPAFQDAGTFTGELMLNPATAAVALLGLIPASADLAFQPAGPATGTLAADGKLTADAKTDISVPSVKVFGLELGGGTDCHTSAPANIALTSPNFSRTAGGDLTGTYALPALTGCGALNDLISPLISGLGNTISLAGSPVTQPTVTVTPLNGRTQ